MRSLLVIIMMTLSVFVSGKAKTVTISVNSEPSGAKVYVDGKHVGTTPFKYTLPGKISKYVYDIDADKVRNPDKPPYSIKFTFVKDGYESVTELWEGLYEYHESGLGVHKQKYYVVKPDGYGVMAVLKSDRNNADAVTGPVASSEVVQNEANGGNEIVVRCNIDSEPDEARVFWRIISQDKKVLGTDHQYLGKTPFKEEKVFSIAGLSNESAKKVKMELTVRKNGYYDETKVVSLSELLSIMEINGFFELQVKE